MLGLCTGWSAFLSVYGKHRLQNCPEMEICHGDEKHVSVFPGTCSGQSVLHQGLPAPPFLCSFLLLSRVQLTKELSESSSLLLIIRPEPRLCVSSYITELLRTLSGLFPPWHALVPLTGMCLEYMGTHDLVCCL